MASLLGVGIVCWLVIISIAVIRLFMFHAERINKTTDDILDTLEHKQEKENVNETTKENTKEAFISVIDANKVSSIKENEQFDCKICGAKLKPTDKVWFNCGAEIKK